MSEGEIPTPPGSGPTWHLQGLLLSHWAFPREWVLVNGGNQVLSMGQGTVHCFSNGPPSSLTQPRVVDFKADRVHSLKVHRLGTHGQSPTLK